MSEETIGTTTIKRHHRPTGLISGIGDYFWNKIPHKYRQNVWPEIQLLPGEIVEVEVPLAWYRDITGNLVFGYFYWFVALILAVTAVLFYYEMSLFMMTIPLMMMGMLIFEAVREYIEYNQWRMVKTNKRLIITMPQRNSWPLVDNIELGTMPRIIDTNWSNNLIWRTFQFFTGARDVYISLTGLQFVEGSAKVKDALIIPDIDSKDVYELKRLIFG